MDLDDLGGKIIGAAIEVHKAFGPGLLENIYQKCLCEELKIRGLSFREQVPLGVSYKGRNLGLRYLVDIVVEDKIILELKNVEAINGLHIAQTLTYLKLAKLNVAYIVNFNSVLLKHSIRRVENRSEL